MEGRILMSNRDVTLSAYTNGVNTIGRRVDWDFRGRFPCVPQDETAY